jgi:signal transduction histidine kinase
MLLNLLINAIQAMPDGGDVLLSAGVQERKVVIRVRDEGCGIAAEVRDKIFDPFFTTKDGGTGLGLAVAHQIVEQHGGILRVDANEVRGMTFSALLPAAGEVSG